MADLGDLSVVLQEPGCIMLSKKPGIMGLPASTALEWRENALVSRLLVYVSHKISAGIVLK